MDVPLDVVQDRDPKGLYKKVRGSIDKARDAFLMQPSSSPLLILAVRLAEIGRCGGDQGLHWCGCSLRAAAEPRDYAAELQDDH